MDYDDDPRVHVMKGASPRRGADYVLHWMQSSQRADDNAALHLALLEANARDLPVLSVFALDDGYPSANERHFAFMLEGLANAAERLEKLGVRLVGRRGSPPETVAALADRAALVVTDTAYLEPARGWRESLAEDLDVPLVRVESDVAVPVELASNKREWAARTIRPKIAKHLDDSLERVPRLEPARDSLALDVEHDFDFTDPDRLLDSLSIERDVPRVKRFRGGTAEARARLTGFVRALLDGYAENRAEADRRTSSELSPYLHFGQIGIGEIVAKVRNAGEGIGTDVDAYLEELLCRRELARNYTWFTPDYDDYAALPDWARRTLAEHRDDERPYRYTRGELERAETDDPYWNAAMKEMRRTGYMHNAMRMYWGKKVIEWCNTPEYAYRTLLYLNNRWFLDGRDPSSYANVAWVFGLHDRPWQERAVFGKVRYMNAAGLERKFDIAAYVERVEGL